MADQTNREETRRPEDRPLTDLVAPILPEKRYYGERKRGGVCEVWCEDAHADVEAGASPALASRRTLPLCLEIRNHSPSGFEWGYGGSGPAQLALALLTDALGDADLAQHHYQDFKFQIVAGWAGSWTISASQIRAFVALRMKT